MIKNILLRKIFFRSFLLLGGYLYSNILYGQQENTDVNKLYEELDSLFENESIPDLFKLADSLLAMKATKISSVSIRAGYVSQVVSAGRTFGFSQYGFIPGVNYYHHSGLYGRLTGYWNSEFNPQYYLTTLSPGYMRSIRKHWMVNATHDFYVYNDTLPEHSFSKSARASVYYQANHADAGVEYVYLYGNETAQRVTLNLNGRFRIKLTGLIKSIVFMPGVYFEWGNANVYSLRQPRTAVAGLRQLIKQNDFPKLTKLKYLRLAYLLENRHGYMAKQLLRSFEYSNKQINTLLHAYYEGRIKEENVFGFMNYSFSLPLVINAGKYTLTTSYSYNIPVALPGETYSYEPNGYFSASLAYTIQWIKKK